MKELWNIIYTASIYATVVGVIIILIKQILKNKINAKWGYLIWSILIIKIIIPYGPESSIGIFNNSYINYENINTPIKNEQRKEEAKEIEDITLKNMEVIKADPNYNNDEITSIENNQTNTNVKNNSINDYIPYIWAMGASITALIFIASNVLLHKKLNIKNLKSDEKLDTILEYCKHKLNIKRNIKIVENNVINTPSIVGIIYPKILIPKSMTDLSEKELEYILLHELAHYKRKDTLVNYLLLILQTIHWFNPIIWYYFRKIREDMEYATDEKVLFILKDEEHNDYGKAILAVLERIKYSRFEPATIGIIDDKKGVQKRIIKIKGMKDLKNKKFISAIIGICIIALLSILLLTSGFNKISQLQSTYFDIAADVIKGKSISSDDLINMLSDIEPETTGGIVGNVDEKTGEQTTYETKVYEFKNKNELLQVAYLGNQSNNKSLYKIDSIVWDINRGNSKEIHISVFYYNPNQEKDYFDLSISARNLSEQEEIFKSIGKTNSMYELYFEIARAWEGQDSLSMKQIKNILAGKKLKESEFELDENLKRYDYTEGNFSISMLYNEKQNNIDHVAIYSEDDKAIGLSYIKDREDGITISKRLDSLDEQKSIIKKLAPIYENSYDSTEKELKQNDENIIKEANKIAKEQGYTIKLETKEEIMNGDSYTFALIKNACVEGGYSEKEIEKSSKDGVNIIGFDLEEKSKYNNGNGDIWLCLLVNQNSEVVGAYLDYDGYYPGIAPVNFKENFS